MNTKQKCFVVKILISFTGRTFIKCANTLFEEIKDFKNGE